MKITALVENTTQKDFPVEHGLSLFIETDWHRILFDTGQSTLFAENAKRMGIDLSTVDLCVLSHGHYDHGGGLKEFTLLNDKAPIYMNRNAFGFYYHGEEKYIGLNRDWIDDEEFRKRVVYTDRNVVIDEQLSILGPKSQKAYEMGSAGLCFREDGCFFPEDFRHEHYLMISENGKRILISGCSHQGIINIMDWFRPDVLVGGFHFMKQELNERLAGYGRELDGFDCTYYTCHCTGVEQYRFLTKYMSKVHYLSEGDTVII
ncbi:MAG: MBL fold metallo-hydrolase [Lachnospiraceae bacterium]|nr:MBL fold metallo-hydrolase [Lachnospiraceae bacterium]